MPLRRVSRVVFITAQNLLEGHAEVVVEDGVQYGIHHRVWVAQPEEERLQGMRNSQSADETVQRVQGEKAQPTTAETGYDDTHAYGGPHLPLV